MTKPAAKPFVSRASNTSDGMAALTRLPGVIITAFQQWKVIEIIVREYKPKKTHEQDKLHGKWCKEAAAQGDMTAEEYRGYTKLHFGVPILCRDSEEYQAAYERVVAPLPYEEKLQLMQLPFDFAVTRGMTTKQKAEFLDECWRHFTGLGFRLTDPNLKGFNPNEYREVA
ncbi:hypothetical protein HZU72_17620 [Halomonas sp. QX-2]|uniref:Uncharacterized protein n=1 Tax=Vreelandella sedimenti TaxID=2729618 RepID=A0A7Z0N9P7_9GAMM|nr:hypothetical protein [Halomonas sedimenti]NYT74233.1 hypothetical protein [Halomonas sedimenti]